jgi:hypothetical protein
MSEQIKSQIISRRRLFWLAAIAVALAAPATMLSRGYDRSSEQSARTTKTTVVPGPRMKSPSQPCRADWGPAHSA